MIKEICIVKRHTQGPWIAVAHPQEHKWAWTIEGATGTTSIIARIGLVDDAKAVAANASLIAAAPDLLDALQECVKWFHQMKHMDNEQILYGNGKETAETCAHIFIRAQAAISKALEGE